MLICIDLVKDKICVIMKDWVKVAPNGNDSVNVFYRAKIFDSVNTFESANVFECINVFDCVNAFNSVNVLKMCLIL